MLLLCNFVKDCIPTSYYEINFDLLAQFIKMTFEEILNHATEILQRRGRVSFRALKRQFDLDDEFLDDIKYELVEIHKVAKEEAGTMLVWTGPDETTKSKERSNENRQVAAERRQLTVMFIDLVGSTELSRRLDPEDLRDIIYAFQDLFDSIVERHQGLVVQHLGDGIMAYFGYPIAHEDDPQRAVMSGLNMLIALKELNERLSKEKKVSLQVRIGVHTGLVVVGATGGKTHSEMLALGEAPNLAARIQGLADPNSLWISAETNKLLRGQFKTTSQGKFKMKGFSEQLELFTVQGEKELSEIDLVPVEGLSPFVGRQVERTQILERWELAGESKGQIVLISGEAGIGKSRLVQSLVEEILNDDVPYLVFKCSPFNRNTTLNPVINTLRSEIKFVRNEAPEISLHKLETFIKEKKLDPNHDLPLYANLLSIALLDQYEVIKTSSGRLKALTFISLIKWLKGDQKPKLILFEDFQWADPSTLELFEKLFRDLHSTTILFIGTFRPEFTPYWNAGPHQMHIVLNRLTKKQTESMIQQLAGALPEVVISDILKKTDGNPLFVEEVTKLLLESGVLTLSDTGYELTSSLKTLSIPSTLQDSLMARLDRLGAAKEIAQIGATIGREFAYILVKAISKLEDKLLIERLEKLVGAEMLLENGELPNMLYTFKHALIQEAAYSSLLKKRRQEFHQRIVDTLETDFPDLMKTNPELMAHHCSEGGLLEKAIPYWRRAGELAVSKSAHQEAIIHLNEGLHILHQLPVTDKRIEDEILFQIALGVPLTALRGYGSDEVEKAYSRARTLCAKLGNTMQLIPTLYGLWRYYLLTAQYSEAAYLSSEILKLSEESSEPLHKAIGNRAAGSTHFYLGELDEARSRLGAIIALEATPETRANTLLFDVVDSWVTARSYESWTLWLGGHTEEAFKQIEAAMEMANQLNHPFSMALSVSFATWLYQFHGDKEKTLQCAQDGLKIAKQNGFSFWVGWGEILEAWALDNDPSDEQFLNNMLAGLEHWKALGSRLGSSYFLYLIAESLFNHGKISDAWTTLDQAKNFIYRTKEGWWEAEIYRMEGRLHEAGGPQNFEKAEACYRKALDKASQQNAKSLELRAANSLASLLAESSKRNEVYLILQEKIKWFNSELDTPDLKDAKSTLHNLTVIET